MAETKKKRVYHALPIGYTLNGGRYPYRIEEVLGQGSYGITYKVSARTNVGNVKQTLYFAIKENFAKSYCTRLSDGVTVAYSDEDAEEAHNDLNDFLAEGERLEKICKGHPNIVNVNETFLANNTAYYAMEYIDGGDLCRLVKARGGQLEESEALDLILPIVEAVSHLHQQHFAHYDIKPENIVIRKGEDGSPEEPILIDFGLTMHYTATGRLTQTSKNRSVGCSDGYAPMEQYLGLTSFCPECDVYALAATLLYMLIGKDPLKASDISAKWIESAMPASTSEQTRKAITNAMKKLKEDRTPRADVLKSDLMDSEAPKRKKQPKKSTPQRITAQPKASGGGIRKSVPARGGGKPTLKAKQKTTNLAEESENRVDKRKVAIYLGVALLISALVLFFVPYIIISIQQ